MDALEALFSQFEDKDAARKHVESERKALRGKLTAPKGFGQHCIEEGRPEWPDEWFVSGDPSHGARCRGLWAAVLHQAWKDATAPTKFQTTPLDVTSARRLLTTRNKDLAIICAFVGIEPELVIAKTLENLPEIEA